MKLLVFLVMILPGLIPLYSLEEETFSIIYDNVVEAAFPHKQLELLKEEANRLYTTEQVKKLLLCLDFSRYRLEALPYFIYSIEDPENADLLLEVLEFTHEVNDAQVFIDEIKNQTAFKRGPCSLHLLISTYEPLTILINNTRTYTLQSSIELSINNLPEGKNTITISDTCNTLLYQGTIILEEENRKTLNITNSLIIEEIDSE